MLFLFFYKYDLTISEIILHYVIYKIIIIT